MRKIFILGIVVILSFSCNNKTNSDYVKVTVNQVEHVDSYTYLLVSEKGSDYWIAVKPMQAKVGDTYRYKGGLLMEDFYSAQLNRTFEKVVFLDEILPLNGSVESLASEQTPGSMAKNEKSNVNIKSVEGGVTIAELFENPETYKGKSVLIKGEVTKFNPAIMDRNWVHIQDGTEFNGKYDLTLTTIEEFEVGSIVVVEGVLSLNKDFGYGYSYEILLEKATAVK